MLSGYLLLWSPLSGKNKFAGPELPAYEKVQRLLIKKKKKDRDKVGSDKCHGYHDKMRPAEEGSQQGNADIPYDQDMQEIKGVGTSSQQPGKAPRKDAGEKCIFCDQPKI